MLKPGVKAPLFTGSSTAGPIDLRNYKGIRPIVLIFYPVDNNPTTSKHLCALRDEASQYKKLNAAVLAINEGSLTEHQAFADQYHYGFPLIHDENGLINRLYEVGTSLMNMFGQKWAVFVIGKEGLIHYSRYGLPNLDEIMKALRHADHYKPVN